MGVCAAHELWMFIGCGEDGGARAERALLIKLKVTDVQSTTSSILSCLSKVNALQEICTCTRGKCTSLKGPRAY